MSVLDLKKEGSVYILTMINGDKQNTFTDEILQEYHRVLDEVEATTENAALILTSDHPKYWTNGINLEWLVTKPQEYHMEFAALLDAFYLKWALLNLPTVGCLTGHAYAGGAILASTLDFRLMREDRGWICFPEVDIRIPFTPTMQAVLALLPNKQARRDMMLTGKRLGGKEAAELKIVDEALPAEDLFNRAMELAQMLAQKDRKTYSLIKNGMRPQLMALKNAQ